MKKNFLIALFLLSPYAAFAGLFDDDVARKRIEDVHQEVIQLQNRVMQFESLRNNQIDQSVTMQQFKEDIAKLVGQIEVLNNQLETLSRQQREFYTDMDTRLRKLESVGADMLIPADTPATTADNAAASQKGEETANFDAALRLFEAGKYSASCLAFQNFLQHYPKSALGPAAQFWVGNAFYAQQKDKEALAAYQKVVKTWPTHPKSAEALLSIATLYKDSKDTLNAKKTLETLIAKHPNSPSAKDARNMLKTL
jgi:tol-pal system protein YbgF